MNEKQVYENQETAIKLLQENIELKKLIRKKTKYKLEEEDLELMKRVTKITLTDYEIDNQDYIEVDALISAISDLVVEIDYLQEKIKDIEQDRDDNYRRIPVAEQVGISDKDFY